MLEHLTPPNVIEGSESLTPFGVGSPSRHQDDVQFPSPRLMPEGCPRPEHGLGKGFARILRAAKDVELEVGTATFDDSVPSDAHKRAKPEVAHVSIRSESDFAQATEG
jgi:hypothetical protein